VEKTSRGLGLGIEAGEHCLMSMGQFPAVLVPLSVAQRRGHARSMILNWAFPGTSGGVFVLFIFGVLEILIQEIREGRAMGIFSALQVIQMCGWA
jgi:hypothetical protein